MADFFKKIGDGFTKAANSVKDTVETSRKRGDLKKQISDAKNNIKSIEIAMGEAIYNAYKNGDRPESFADSCKEIDNLKVEIKVLRAKLLELDGIKSCEKCGAEITADSAFCSICGARQTGIFKDETEDDDFSDDDNMISL